MAKVPARLYKYQPFTELTLSNLAQASFWFSAPENFNDPFDCALSVFDPDNISEEGFQRALAYVRKRQPEVADRMCPDKVPTPLFRETFRDSVRRIGGEQVAQLRNKRGVSCFSEHNDDIMMWSHYADGHRGFCLELVTTLGDPFTKTKQVIYRDKTPQLDPVNVLERDPKYDSEELFEALVLTKAPCWSYEREWRAMHKEANTLFGYGYKALTGIYFGAAMTVAHKDIISILLRDRPTQLHVMQPDQDGFRLRSRAVTYTPYPFKVAG